MLWIVHSWLFLQSRVSKVNSALDCPFLIAPSISCAQGWQCSGLSILDCSFNLVCPKLTVLWIVHSWMSSLRFSLTFICQCLWIVHSWSLLQSRVPKVDSALDCPFLIVVPSVFSNVYFSVSLDCPFLIARSISCAQGWQCSGLSILDCSFNLVCPKLTVLWIVHSWLSSLRFSLTFICQCVCGLSILDCSFNLVCPKLTVIWIVHSWLLLKCRVPKVDSALDCPFLIAPSISCVQSWQCSGLSILDCSFNLVCPKLTVLWIVHSWLSSLRFSLTFICQCLWIVHSWLLLQSRVPKVDSALDCPSLIAPSISCVQSWQCSGLSILDCSFNVVCPKLTVLWIVHSWLLLQSRVPKVDNALDCPFLIVPSVFSNVYLSVSMDCPFLIAPSISCAQGWQCSGLSILDCSFNLVCTKLTVLWIVHSWLLLQSRVPKVDSALDCPFLIAPSISCAQSWQCSGLSILDCSFNLVCPKLTVLWSVHSWLLLQSRVPKVDSALDCTFLIIPSVFSNVYFSVSLDCPFLIAPSISCAQGWQCSGLSILDCSFNLVCPKLTVLWIVHSWLLLQCRVPKVDSALDCPFLIAPSISCA